MEPASIRVPVGTKPLARSGEITFGFPGAAVHEVQTCTVDVVTNDGQRTGESFWIRRPSRSRQLQVEVKSVAPPCVAIYPELVILGAPGASRKMTLVNESLLPISVFRIRTSRGFSVESFLAPVTLYPGGGKVELLLTSEADAPERGEVSVLDEHQSPLAFAQIHLQPLPELKELIRYTIGIDFGTSGTSIVLSDANIRDEYGVPYVEFLPEKYEGELGNVEATNRFPTTIYCLDADRQKWYYGSRAEKEFSDKKGQGALILQLKSRLRGENLQLDNSQPHLNALELATWYFEQLVADFILPRIGPDLDDGDKVRFVISLPVLRPRRAIHSPTRQHVRGRGGSSYAWYGGDCARTGMRSRMCGRHVAARNGDAIRSFRVRRRSDHDI